jgi:hypothetical protein
MMRIKLSTLVVTVGALMSALPIVAASGTAADNAAAKTTSKVMRSTWPSETLSGKITMVDPVQRLVVIQAQDGVTYDLDVTKSTRINSGEQSIALKDLAQDMNKTASVTIVPERRGDIARVIQIKG